MRKTLFIISSKSGTTLETTNFYRHFWKLAGEQNGRSQFRARRTQGRTTIHVRPVAGTQAEEGLLALQRRRCPVLRIGALELLEP
ncbi:MAG: hypothetical protein ACREL7_06250 [Longimicrobiales bacterium]